jgi:peptidoglycan/LPS O-acetylase OafA/YrhL
MVGDHVDSVITPRCDIKQLSAARPVKSYYRPELDVLRFFAFLLVFLYHVFPEDVARWKFISVPYGAQVLSSAITSMACGVCLFFTLSAYLITTLLIREHQLTDTVDLAAFYQRRILRIWPLYFFALCLAFSVCTFYHGFPRFATIAAYLLMAGNLGDALHWHFDVQPLRIFHLWSISVEEQFYILFPLIARSFKVRYLPAFSGLILLLMAGAIFYTCHTGGGKENLWYSSCVQFGMFAGGIMVAYVFAKRSFPRIKMLLRVVLFSAGSLACFGAEYFLRIHGSGLYVGAPRATIGYLLVMLGCSTVLIAILGYSGPLPRIFIYLGKISYGLYVFHIWAIYLAAYLLGLLLHMSFDQGATPLRLVALKDLLALALTILMAAVSYRWLEKPFLKLKHRFEVIKSRPA